MRIFRFDHEVSVPVAYPGTDVRVGPVTGGANTVRVDVVHIPPGGRLDTGSNSRVFFGVVAGSGWLAADAQRRDVGAGSGAEWAPGERGEAGSVEGMTAVRVEGDFEVWALAVSQEILVEDYDPDWPGRFEKLCRYIWPAVAAHAVRIDHVGSTSVPGLPAKPVIDMDIVVASSFEVRPVIEGLESVGYRWRGDLGVVGRQAFAPPGPTVAEVVARHHLYVVVEDSKAHLDHWLLRDLLREDASARQEYAGLKRGDAILAGGDMDAYVAAKASFVASLLTRARSERGLPPAEYWEPEAPRTIL